MTKPDYAALGKTLKLTFEYEHGMLYLDGADLEKYLSQINSVIGFMHVTRPSQLPQDFLDVEWKVPEV